MIETLVTVAHVFFAIILVVAVLFQHGKGASVGAAFGGSSQTIFGPRGPFELLAKVTTVVAVGFMLTSLTLSYFSDSRRFESIIPESEVSDEDKFTLPNAPEDSNGPTSAAPGSQPEPAVESDGPVTAPKTP